MPALWADTTMTWYAALVATAGAAPYGLARRIPTGEGIRYETWDRVAGRWTLDPDPLAVFTSIGGVNDAEPVDQAEARRILRSLGGSDL